MTLAHASVARSEIWGAWTFDPLMVAALVVAGWLYARGVRHLWGHGGPRAVRPRQVAAYFAGLSLIALALMSPVEALASTLVSGHMAQHLVLLVVAPPLFVYAAPGLVLTTALPVPVRRRLNRMRWAAVVPGVVSGAAIGVAIHATTMWAWHLPGPYQAAVENELVHMAEHATFFVSALLFWGLLIQPRARRRVPHPVAMFGAIVVWILSGGLGALLSFATRPLYPVMTHDALAWGIDPLADQHLAGVIMWVPAGFTYLVAIAVLFVRWMDSMDRRAPAPAEVPR